MPKARAWPNFRLLISLNEISRSVPSISKEVLEQTHECATESIQPAGKQPTFPDDKTFYVVCSTYVQMFFATEMVLVLWAKLFSFYKFYKNEEVATCQANGLKLIFIFF